MQQVRFGIVGVGNMGSAHLSHILRGNVPELKVTAVADINPARLKAAKAAAEKAGQPIEGFPTAAALFESGLCDAVIIATPHYDHIFTNLFLIFISFYACKNMIILFCARKI